MKQNAAALLTFPSLFIEIISICCELSTILIHTNIFINVTVVAVPDMGGNGHQRELEAYVYQGDLFVKATVISD